MRVDATTSPRRPSNAIEMTSHLRRRMFKSKRKESLHSSILPMAAISTARESAQPSVVSPLLHRSSDLAPPTVEMAGVSGKNGEFVDVAFKGEANAAFRFHALWLRDACRDEQSVAGVSGERNLAVSPVGPFSAVDLKSIRASAADVLPSGDVVVHWTSGDVVSFSKFSGEALRAYANVVAQPIERVVQGGGEEAGGPSSLSSSESSSSPSSPLELLEFLEPYTGFPDAQGPDLNNAEHINLWRGKEADIKRFDYADVLDKSDVNLALLKAALVDGAALIENVPDDEEKGGEVLREFVYEAFGGLQKDPARSEANWRIEKRENPSSISYDHDKALAQHTDQSIPPHGLSGVALIMHYIDGAGKKKTLK
eukprot:jgi/Bigna1/81181/fgenesh1_pg.78_\